MTSPIWESSLHSSREDGASLAQAGAMKRREQIWRCNLEVELTELSDWLIVAFYAKGEGNYNSQFLAQITEKMGVLCMTMSYEEGTNYKEKYQVYNKVNNQELNRTLK